MEAALGSLFDEPVKVTVAGRTDAGVHASGQVISFVSHDRFPVERLAIALNTVLPADLSACAGARVGADFSARNSALARHYVYTVLNRRHPSAVRRRFAAHDHRALDDERMRDGAARLIGQHDFVTFCGVVPDRGTTVRTLHGIEIERNGDLVRFRFAGIGFLHRMVRIITGTLLEVGAGRRTPESVAGMLAARDRRVAGPTAPAHGLCLVNVVYAGFESASAASRRSG